MNLQQLQEVIENAAKDAHVKTKMVYNRITKEPYLEVETKDDMMVLNQGTDISRFTQMIRNFA